MYTLKNKPVASLDKTYQPKNTESQIYQLWESAGAFRPRSEGKPFVIVLPPPNANAELHCGHALDFQIKDVLARWQRLGGRSVLLIPGADHAGFETWSVYEKHLAVEGKSRFDFDRQDLYNRVFDFVASQKGKMTDQLRRLGISCDWDRFLFSLDDKVVEAAKATFHKMWQEGLIYRGKRLVNYCPAHATSFADIEVDYDTRQGHLCYISYPLANDDQRTITVATTRPETMLGDTAVAVHPDDQRWQQLIGQSVCLPISQRVIPIIADKAVEPDFGTGAVKVTPGHDFTDGEIGDRHDLPVIDLLDETDRLADYDWLPNKYHGQTLPAARQMVVDDLTAAGRLDKTEDYSHRVGECYKCQTPIEPLRRPQWFVRMKPLTDQAIAALEAEQIRFYPDRKRHELIAYLKQLHDWNISRQIVWGIPIPVAQNTNNPDDWIFDDRTDRTDLMVDGQTYRPDPDVFDTWWSSGHWPWVSLDWPDQPNGYYPNSLMETGEDILKQWVSRMICLGLYATGEVPFKVVGLHGMVIDKHGVKMSKSKGNVVNPIEVIDHYGSDAIRLALNNNLSLGQPQGFSLEKIKAGANFCNKLWNIGRYIQAAANNTAPNEASGADDWINQQFNQTRLAITADLDNYRFGEALAKTWQFIWHQLADWYIESTKWRLKPESLALVWRQTLRLVHPWAPFVSEKLWQETVSSDPDNLLIGQQWEAMPDPDPNRVADFDRVVAIVRSLRTLLARANNSEGNLELLESSRLADYCDLFSRLTKLPARTVNQPTGGNLWAIETGRKPEIWLHISPQGRAALIDQLRSDLKAREAELTSLQKRLVNPAYLEQAPPEIVQDSQNQLTDRQREVADLTGWLERLDG